MNPNTLDISLDTASVLTKPPEPPAPRPRRELLTPLTEEGHYLLVVDNSAAEHFVCPQLAAYYLFYGREGHARNAALTFGGACHVGLEHIERDEGHHRMNEITYEPFVWTEADTARDVLRYFTENPAPPDEYRTPQVLLEILAHYRVRKTLPDYEWTVQSDKDGPLIERAFELPLGVLEVNAEIQLPQWDKPRFVKQIHVAWSGRIDLVPFCNGKNRICDNKTTSMGGDQFVQDFFLSSQSRGYIWAGQQLWPDLNIDGFCLNAIHFRKPVAGVGLLEKGPRGGKPALDFFRAYFDYSQFSIDQWAENALVRVEDFVHCIVRKDFPMETTYCFNRKYGKCDYHDLCCIGLQEGFNVRDKMLMSDAYRDVTWNPVR
jgi:hypothetical protein